MCVFARLIQTSMMDAMDKGNITGPGKGHLLTRKKSTNGNFIILSSKYLEIGIF